LTYDVNGQVFLQGEAIRMTEINRFAQFVRDDAAVTESLGNLKQISEVTAFAKQLGYAVTDDEVGEFLNANRTNAPEHVVNSIAASGNKIDFSEESIIRFARQRLQIDTDY
jgi:hypothetical protein